MGDGVTSDSFSGFFSAALAIVEAARQRNVPLRLLGATAIYYQCPNSSLLAGVMKRQLTDLDFVTLSKYNHRIPELFASLHLVPNERVNTLYGAHRQIYYDPQNSRQVDVFFDKLSFNHEINFEGRFDLDPVTISLADLLLEKLQIVKMSEKDAKDIIVLVHGHDIGDGSAGTIDANYVAKLLSNDWGFYYTTVTNLKKVRDYLRGVQSLSDADRALVEGRLDALTQRIESEKKSLKWNLRAKVGTRTPWYSEAEDVENRRLN